MKLEAKDIFEKLKAEFGDSIIELKEDKGSDPFITIDSKKILDVSLSLRDTEEFLFDYLSSLSGMDYKTNLGVVYHLFSTKHNHKIAVKVILDKGNPSLLSVEGVWKSANWHEREAWDMYGIKFEGHPNLIRILSPYDWEGYPLRKDYKTPEYYHGFKVPY
jgi:NADH-quinone oxidoreductase subunit C